jgi:hypothetical protein
MEITPGDCGGSALVCGPSVRGCDGGLHRPPMQAVESRCMMADCPWRAGRCREEHRSGEGERHDFLGGNGWPMHDPYRTLRSACRVQPMGAAASQRRVRTGVCGRTGTVVEVVSGVADGAMTGEGDGEREGGANCAC